MPELILRDYQVAAVEALRSAYRNGARAPLLVAHTGSGKTVIFAHICSSAAARGNRVLILCHRQELIHQASSKLNMLGIPHVLCMPGYTATSQDQVIVASVQTAVRRLSKIGEFQLIICDEAHRTRGAATWEVVLASQPHAKILGVTATPQRLSGEGLGINAGGIFDVKVEGPSIPWLVAHQYLAPTTVYWPPGGGIQAIGLHKKGGDYAIDEDSALMDKTTITGDAIAHYRKRADGLQALVFCCTVNHARNVAEAFSEAGIPAEAIDGSMTTVERTAMLGRFESRETRVLTSCEIISEGFDCPGAACAIMLRHTDSMMVYRQQAGRIMRYEPGKRAVILDHVGNARRHLLPDHPVVWSLDGRLKYTEKDSSTEKIWQCPGCGAINSVDDKICRGCDEPRPVKARRPPQVIAGELVEAVKPWDRIGLNYDQYVAVVVERERKREMEDRRWLEKVAARKGYSPRWVDHVVRAKHQTRMHAAMASGQMRLDD